MIFFNSRIFGGIQPFPHLSLLHVSFFSMSKFLKANTSCPYHLKVGLNIQCYGNLFEQSNERNDHVLNKLVHEQGERS